MNVLVTSKSRLKLVLNIAVLGISLIGVSRKNFQDTQASLFESLIIESFAPIQNGVYFIRHKLSYFVNHYIFMINADIENELLKKKIANLEASIYELSEIERENQRLKKLLQFGEDIKHKKVLAQIIAWDSSREFRVLRINKGIADGVQPKSTVVTANGLVGYVYRLTNDYADVLTILDQNMRVDSIVDRTRSHGIVEGFANSKCMMKYVTRTEPVKEGDQVVTSGLGNIYPKGLRVGVISKIERESYGITQLVEVTPSVDFSKIEEVIVLTPLQEIKSVSMQQPGKENHEI